MVNLSVQQLRIIVVKKMVNPLWNLEEHVWCGFWAPVLKKGTMTTPTLGMPPAPSGGRDEGKKGRPCAKRRKLKCRFQRIRMPVHTMSLCPRRRKKDLRHWNSWSQSKDFEKERDKNRNLDTILYNILQLQSSTFIANKPTWLYLIEAFQNATPPTYRRMDETSARMAPEMSPTNLMKINLNWCQIGSPTIKSVENCPALVDRSVFFLFLFWTSMFLDNLPQYTWKTWQISVVRKHYLRKVLLVHEVQHYTYTHIDASSLVF